jgi:hypothetical protein
MPGIMDPGMAGVFLFMSVLFGVAWFLGWWLHRDAIMNSVS